MYAACNFIYRNWAGKVCLTVGHPNDLARSEKIWSDFQI